jgi:hypothetical protein
MQKLIDLDEETKMLLEIKAAKAKKKLKIYIQDLLIKHSKK